MDVVYVCRPGNRNEELRYSLRSLVNLPHDRVFIAGGYPRWVQGVKCVDVPRTQGRYVQTTLNLLAAIDAGCSERFVLMNDDIFIMAPISEPPNWYRGRIVEVAASHQTTSYARRLAELGKWLRAQGYSDLCYELHVPMTLEADKVIEAMRLPAPLAASHVAKRSLYGNVFEVGGERHRDVKVLKGHWSKDWAFLSTEDAAFAHDDAGKYVRDRFQTPSPYESP